MANVTTALVKPKGESLLYADPPRERRCGKGMAGIAVAVGVLELFRGTGVLPGKFVLAFYAIVERACQGPSKWIALGSGGSDAAARIIGLAIASAIGVVLGILMVRSRGAAALQVIVRFLRPLPSVALIPS